jgi:hypothetical protein
LIQPSPVQFDPATLHATIAQLQERMRLMEEQREEMIERRRRRLLILGGAVSLLLHFVLLACLGMVGRGGVGGEGDVAVTVEFVGLDSGPLSELEQESLSDLLPDVAASEDINPTDVDAQLSAISPAIEIGDAASRSMQALQGGDGSGGLGGGAGSGDGSGLGLAGGGGGGTSFFGVSSKGRRFAYIVDVSASMGEGGKMATSMRELARSLESLPDYAEFYIVLFSTNFVEPPMQKGWTRAKKSALRQIIRWLGQVGPNGGTQPRPAFLQIFSLTVRPDVVFFLTDGQVQDFTAEECAALNDQGKKVVINTIAFGDPSSQDLLKEIARQSGGLYRFVPSGATP